MKQRKLEMMLNDDNRTMIFCDDLEMYSRDDDIYVIYSRTGKKTVVPVNKVLYYQVWEA